MFRGYVVNQRHSQVGNRYTNNFVRSMVRIRERAERWMTGDIIDSIGEGVWPESKQNKYRKPRNKSR